MKELIGKEVHVWTKNQRHYQGKLISDDDDFVCIDDKINGKMYLSKKAISELFET